MIFNHTLATFFVSCCVLAGSVDAAPLLNFQAGQKASYVIQQTLTGGGATDFGDAKFNFATHLGFDVTIISVDPQTGNFPFEVEVKITRIETNDQILLPFTKHQVTYNSSKKNNNPALQKLISKLMSAPLRFKVHQDFEVVEVSGKLEKFADRYMDRTDLALVGGSSFTYRMLLGQIFHLAGEEEGKLTYPVVVHTLANWEEEPSSYHSAYKIKNRCSYTITKQSNKVLQGTWIGTGSVNSDLYELNNSVALEGKVTWLKANPLVQTRDITFKLKEKDLGDDQLNVDAVVHQKWSSR